GSAPPTQRIVDGIEPAKQTPFVGNASVTHQPLVQPVHEGSCTHASIEPGGTGNTSQTRPPELLRRERRMPSASLGSIPPRLDKHASGSNVVTSMLHNPRPGDVWWMGRSSHWQSRSRHSSGKRWKGASESLLQP